MRSSLGSMRSLNLHSQIGGPMSTIRANNNNISKQPRTFISDEIPNFDKILLGSALTQKQIIDLKRVGYIYKKLENGDVYYGSSEEEKPHGNGIYIYQSIDSNKQPYFYKGGFQNGEFNGFGKLCKIINDKEAIFCYQGYWKNGKREGEGRQNYNLESTVYYKGGWANDQRSGLGVLVLPDGQYEGMWVKGKMNGNGNLTIERGPLRTVVSGQWLDDKINYGTIQYFSKSNNELIGRYQGGIKNLVRDGQGRYSSGGIQMEGTFQEDDLVGYSTLKNSNTLADYVIKGDFNSPVLQNFQSNIQYKNNDRYEGLVDISADNVVRRTNGRYYFSDGVIEEGRFEDNEKGKFIKK